jgi:hypothetical protein
MHTHIILWYSTFTQIYTHWPDRNAVLASRQCLLHIMTGCCKSSCGTVVHTGAVTWYDFPSDISLRYAFGKNLMMLTQKSNKKIVLNWLAFYFHRQSDDNHIMRTVKEIWSDFNWSINLVNIVMFTCSLIKSVFVIWFISYFTHCSVSTFQKNTKTKKTIVFDMSSVISILPSSCVTPTSIYLK